MLLRKNDKQWLATGNPFIINNIETLRKHQNTSHEKSGVNHVGNSSNACTVIADYFKIGSLEGVVVLQWFVREFENSYEMIWNFLCEKTSITTTGTPLSRKAEICASWFIVIQMEKNVQLHTTFAKNEHLCAYLQYTVKPRIHPLDTAFKPT